MKSQVKVGVVPAVLVLALPERRKILHFHWQMLLVGQDDKLAESVDVVVEKWSRFAGLVHAMV